MLVYIKSRKRLCWLISFTLHSDPGFWFFYPFWTACNEYTGFLIYYSSMTNQGRTQKKYTTEFFFINDSRKDGVLNLFYIPYARHYKPRLVFLFTHFSLRLRLILQSGHYFLILFFQVE
jgi:hypothetical protein